LKRSGLIAAVVAAVTVVTAVAIGMGSASAAPSGNKGKPQPSPTVTVSPTTTPVPTVTETVVPAELQLNCTKTGDYVVAQYVSASGTAYDGAVLTDGTNLDGSLNVLATFGAGGSAKFPLVMLPSGVVVTVQMVTTSGQTVASCSVNTGYYDPRG
jgi:hypothetical protein